MAGLAEQQTDPADSFWTWREQMYRYAGLIEPDDLQAIAAQLYVEMLKSGYTAVCEFHYLHHQRDGRPYADASAMSRALVAAADEAGIDLCLLPVLYMQGGFDGRALSARQQRFGHEVDAFLRLVDALRRDESDALQVGIALHSLRAVPPEAMRAVLAAEAGTGRPIHIHVAEQLAEVDECLALRGTRPVSWLLEQTMVDARWTLDHATRRRRKCRRSPTPYSDRVACPTTEANLGDGLFPLPEYSRPEGSLQHRLGQSYLGVAGRGVALARSTGSACSRGNVAISLSTAATIGRTFPVRSGARRRTTLGQAGSPPNASATITLDTCIRCSRAHPRVRNARALDLLRKHAAGP
jgi:formimidoylglutamate deiminase